MLRCFHTTDSLDSGSGSLKRIAAVQQLFPQARLHRSVLYPTDQDLAPRQKLSLDTTLLLLERVLGHGVLLAHKLLFRSSKRDPHLLVYELFRAIARFSRGSVALVTPGSTLVSAQDAIEGLARSEPEGQRLAEELQDASSPRDEGAELQLATELQAEARGPG